jgi:hypothetical protein
MKKFVRNAFVTLVLTLSIFAVRHVITQDMASERAVSGGDKLTAGQHRTYWRLLSEGVASATEQNQLVGGYHLAPAGK